MRELEASLQEFGEFLLKARLVRENAAPYCLGWVRRFLRRPASNEPVADQVRGFCEDLEREGVWQDWQIRQAEQALRIYFVNFLRRADWVRRFFAYATERQQLPHPRVQSDLMRDYLTHLAVRQHVSASTQNQALCALLFLCREVLALNVEDLSQTTRARRGLHLPVVLSVPGDRRPVERDARPAVVDGGGHLWRRTPCVRVLSTPRQGPRLRPRLLFVRGGKGAKDRSTLLAEVGRDERPPTASSSVRCAFPADRSARWRSTGR